MKAKKLGIFVKKIDSLAKESENFESLPLQQQQHLLGKWDSPTIKDWVLQAKFARICMMNGQLVVSEETWQKLKRVHKLYPEDKIHCVIF